MRNWVLCLPILIKTKFQMLNKRHRRILHYRLFWYFHLISQKMSSDLFKMSHFRIDRPNMEIIWQIRIMTYILHFFCFRFRLNYAGFVSRKFCHWLESGLFLKRVSFDVNVDSIRWCEGAKYRVVYSVHCTCMLLLFAAFRTMPTGWWHLFELTHS